MIETSKNKRGWHIVRRVLIALAILATLVAIFYTEEDWRGKRAWENCKRELEAQGVVLDWDKFIPPPVPDDQNFFKAPKMAEWFVRAPSGLAQATWTQTNDLGRHLDATHPFAVAKQNGSNGPVQVARIFFTPLNGTNTLRFDNPATAEQVRVLIRNTIGQAAAGAQGLTLTAKKLDQIQPVEIHLAADNTPSADQMNSYIGTDVVSNYMGNLRVDPGVDGNSFRVLLVPHASISAEDYLAWSDQALPDFDLIRKALQRPYARMDGDYPQPFEGPFPNFVAVRLVAQTLDQRAKSYLLLSQPEKALHEVTLERDICRLLVGGSAYKPMTLVGAMIDVAVTGLYVSTIADGFRLHAWREPQIRSLEEKLAQINMLPDVVQSVQSERAGVCKLTEADLIRQTINSRWGGVMRGWLYQNLVVIAKMEQAAIEGIDLGNNVVLTKRIDLLERRTEAMGSHFGRYTFLLRPYTFLAAIAVPNYLKAFQTTARNQTLVNEAQIVCALERYELAHGEYPESLDALMPQFVEKLPHDIIGGQPLHYRRTDDGKFLLYSVGWNETDDGGQPSPTGQNGQIDFSQGDWVWQN